MWWDGAHDLVGIDNHEEVLPNFDLPLDKMVQNFFSWATTFDSFWYEGSWEQRRKLGTDEFRRVGFMVRRVNTIANQLNGSTHLFRMAIELDSNESELMVEVLNKCPPQEYIQQ
jgi:hypothetical protein